MSGLQRRKAATALFATGVIAMMLGLTAAAVPLYRLFCAGDRLRRHDPARRRRCRRRRSRRPSRSASTPRSTPELPWTFEPAQREVEVRIGEQSLAYYRATNRSDRAIVGQAVFNVTPFKAGPYFDKIACFCFEEQLLQPGEEVDMPVSFFVDPAILDDPNTGDVRTITLSYTFFMLERAAGAQPSS